MGRTLIPPLSRPDPPAERGLRSQRRARARSYRQGCLRIPAIRHRPPRRAREGRRAACARPAAARRRRRLPVRALRHGLHRHHPRWNRCSVVVGTRIPGTVVPPVNAASIVGKFPVTQPQRIVYTVPGGVADPEQNYGDLYRPVNPAIEQNPSGGPLGAHPSIPTLPAQIPVVVLLHGGGWRTPASAGSMAEMARSLVSHGVAVWNVEYRRIGAGGGYPTTLTDAAAAIDFLQTVKALHAPNLDLDDVVVAGHSAGGQLAVGVGAVDADARRHGQRASGDPRGRGLHGRRPGHAPRRRGRQRQHPPVPGPARGVPAAVRGGGPDPEHQPEGPRDVLQRHCGPHRPADRM
ncbi:alpha/beta hydrolase [Tsukamurella sp. PLM1]|uniref:alpha/beta hydrolase n=1 Tax=Tsukamurella sp. PLM1 TaxID=2929795 RepID=UPI0035301AB3